MEKNFKKNIILKKNEIKKNIIFKKNEKNLKKNA